MMTLNKILEFSKKKDACLPELKRLENAIKSGDETKAWQVVLKHKSWLKFHKCKIKWSEVAKLTDGCYTEYVLDYQGNDTILIDNKRNFKNGKMDGLFIKYNYLPGSSLYGTESIFYKNGKRHGTFIITYSDGSLKVESIFKNDKLHGTYIEYYTHGGIKNIVNYKNGKFHGTYKEYFINGKIFRDLNFKNGKQHGLKTIYNSLGIVEFSAICNNGLHSKIIKE